MNTGRVTACTGATCGAAIQWEITAAGKRTPVNLDGSPHWATCPDVKRFQSSRTVINVPPRHAMTGAIDHLFDTRPSTPKDDPMSDITKASDVLDKAHATKNGKHAAGDAIAPKSEASEVIAPTAAPPSVKVERDEDDAPSVMATAMKIVRLLERHKTPEEQGRVMLCVVAGSGLSSMGGIAAAATRATVSGGGHVAGSGE